MTEALSSSTKLPPFRQIEIKTIDKNVVKTTSNDVHATLDNNDVYDDDDDDNDDNNDEDDEETGDASQHPVVVTLHQHLQPQIGPHPSLMGKTIVASDNDVTNGFVKDGKMLPYVFEANESGNLSKFTFTIFRPVRSHLWSSDTLDQTFECLQCEAAFEAAP